MYPSILLNNKSITYDSDGYDFNINSKQQTLIIIQNVGIQFERLNWIGLHDSRKQATCQIFHGDSYWLSFEHIILVTIIRHDAEAPIILVYSAICMYRIKLFKLMRAQDY